MSVSDPVADLLTRIRNALKAEHRYTEVRWSKLKESIVAVLKEQGLIEDYHVKREGSIGTIRIMLKYNRREPAIQGLKRVSKPGMRQYVAADEIPSFYGKLGVSILSTSQGVMSGFEARKKKIGGELLCTVW